MELPLWVPASWLIPGDLKCVWRARYGQRPARQMPRKRPGGNAVPRTKVSVQEGRTDKQAQVDQILDKIGKSGYDSLSKEEKEFLFKFSKEG